MSNTGFLLGELGQTERLCLLLSLELCGQCRSNLLCFGLQNNAAAALPRFGLGRVRKFCALLGSNLRRQGASDFCSDSVNNA